MALPEVPATFTKYPASLGGPVRRHRDRGRQRRLGGGAGRRDRPARRPRRRGRRVEPRRRAHRRPGHQRPEAPVRGRRPVLARQVAPRLRPDGPVAGDRSTRSPNPDDLALGCSVDGEVVQDARTSDLVFSVPSLIAQLSDVLPLLPGDVIFTGTPAGVGVSRKPAASSNPATSSRRGSRASARSGTGASDGRVPRTASARTTPTRPTSPHAFPEQLADLGEVQMNYATVGDASKPALLLIPGQTESWWGYEDALPLLAEHFQAFAVDLRGQGRSTRTPGRYTLDNMGNDLVRFIDRVIGRPTFVSGLSSGGVLSAWLSAYAKPGPGHRRALRGPAAVRLRGQPRHRPGHPPGHRLRVPPLEHVPRRPVEHRRLGRHARRPRPTSSCRGWPTSMSPPDEPPQNLKEYDPEWGRAFWTGTVAASCDHERMLRARQGPGAAHPPLPRGRRAGPAHGRAVRRPGRPRPAAPRRGRRPRRLPVVRRRWATRCTARTRALHRHPRRLGRRDPRIVRGWVSVVVTPSRPSEVGTLTVRRALPHRGRRTVGAWCFVDHMGPVAGHRGAAASTSARTRTSGCRP